MVDIWELLERLPGGRDVGDWYIGYDEDLGPYAPGHWVAQRVAGARGLSASDWRWEGIARLPRSVEPAEVHRIHWGEMLAALEAYGRQVRGAWEPKDWAPPIEVEVVNGGGYWSACGEWSRWMVEYVPALRRVRINRSSARQVGYQELEWRLLALPGQPLRDLSPAWWWQTAWQRHGARIWTPTQSRRRARPTETEGHHGH